MFYEGFPQLVLYVQDVKTAEGAAIWSGVFIADTSTPGAPRITLAREGVLIAESPERLHLHLTNGSTHETDRSFPDRYQISTFDQTDIPIDLPQADTAKDQEPAPVGELGTWQLLAVQFCSDVGFDAGAFGGHVKAGSAVDSVAIEQRHSGHVQLGAGVDQLFRQGSAFEKAECGSGVELNEHHRIIGRSGHRVIKEHKKLIIASL